MTSRTTYTTDLAPLSADADGAGGEMFRAVEKKMGMIPNMYRGMAVMPDLLATYMDGYNRFRATSGFTPQEQEVVFLAISRFHGCTYCMAAHSFVADAMSKVPPEITGALRDGRPLPDPRLEALRAFAHHMTESRGNPGKTEVAAFHAAGFADQHILAIILALATKTISNFTNHLFDTEVDAAFAGHAWQAAA